MSIDDQDARIKSADAPRFCPRCGSLDERGPALCAACGEMMERQAYCPVCEDYWPRAAGTPCPKHEIELETDAPRGRPGSDLEVAPTWVNVATFADVSAADPSRIRLEAEGIPTFLDGERMGSRSMYSVATGGVKLQVPATQLDAARVLLAQTWSTPASPDDLDDAWEELAPEPGARRRRVMKVILLLVLLPPLGGALMVLIAIVLAILGY
jgi:hypothetical protein